MKRFFRNGNIETIDNYKNDSLNGISLKYEENGVLISEISYKNGKKNGIIKQYFSDGSPFITGKYANDQYDGKWEYFDMEGFLVGEGNFKNGTGVLMGYDNNGNITRKVHYKNSLINKEEIYSKENNQIEKTIIYENGRIVRTVTD
jgi:antitoxin component YwqK of YwqJK toxin-antitoxin module